MSAETPWQRTAPRFLGLVEHGDRPLEVLVVAELEHRGQSAADDDRVERVEVEVGEPRGVFEQCSELGRAQEAHRDQVVGRPLGRVARIGQRVDHDAAAVGAGDGDVVASAPERVVGVGQLGGPEAHGPPGCGRGPGISDDHEHPRAPGGRHVDDLVMGVSVLDGHGAHVNHLVVGQAPRGAAVAGVACARRRGEGAVVGGKHAA
jgi:hypothetical protein